MSAYLCDARHLSAVAELLAGFDKGGNAEDYFHDLLAENIKSLQARYPNDEHGCDYRYKPIGVIIPWSFDRMPRATLCAWLKALQCYEYQSCEHGGWASCKIGNKVRAAVDRIEGALVQGLPEYDKAAWGWA